MSHSETTDHLVIGGGIMGLLTAYFLLEAGEKVTIVERNEIGKEASWAGGGILSPLYPWQYPQAVTDLAQWSQSLYPSLTDHLKQVSGIDPQWVNSGLLILETEQEQALAWATQTGTPMQAVATDELHTIEPKANTRYESGVWLPTVAQVRNPRLVKALKKTLLAKKAVIKEQTAVADILVKDERAIGVEILQGGGTGRILSENVIITCGAWSASMVSRFGMAIDVEPVRGQMILFHTSPGDIKRILLANGHYIIPRLDGSVLAGSTIEYVGFDKQTTDDAKEMLLKKARQIAPCLEHSRLIHHWAGLRPGSSTNIPTICEHPVVRKLFLNAGHFRNGVVMGPASAKLLTQLILKQPTTFNPLFYLLK